MKIYIFEDAETNSILFEECSRAYGAVEKFTSCSDIDKIDFNRRGIILADVHLLDGLFIDHIQTIRNKQKYFMPILLISGKDFTDSYVESGADEFFEKPVPLHKLKNRLMYWTGVASKQIAGQK